MTAELGHGDEHDDLPERVIVVREAAEPEATDAEIAALIDEVVAAERAADVEVLDGEVLDDEAEVDEVDEVEEVEDESADEAERAAMIDDVGEDTAPFRWPEEVPAPVAAPVPQPPLDLAWERPERDETDPSALRPKAPEPVLVTRTTSRSRAHRAASRLRALIGLVIVVVLSGFALAAAIGFAVLLLTVVLSKAFGSG